MLTTMWISYYDSSVGEESAGDSGLISGSGRFTGEGIGYPLQYSGLEDSMDCVVHGVAKSQKTTEQLLLSYICGLPPTPILPLEVTAEHRALPLAASTSYLTHGSVRTSVPLSVCPPSPSPAAASQLSASASILALQTGSSVPFV